MHILSADPLLQFLSGCQPPQCSQQVLQKAGRCFVCLHHGHISRECHSQGRCPKCGGKHHGSICSRGTDSSNAIPSVPERSGNTTSASQSRANLSIPSTASSRDESATDQQPTLNAGAPSFQSQDSRSTTSLWVRLDQAVLLQTVQTLAFNPEVPQKSQQVRIVLDCGSQRSYVTERLMKELSLNAQGEQPLTIMTFGSKEEKSQICKSARVGLLHKDGRAQQLSLLVVPLTCEPLTYQPISFCEQTLITCMTWTSLITPIFLHVQRLTFSLDPICTGISSRARVAVELPDLWQSKQYLAGF